ncbi:MAG: Gfo/Idh/MocA family oxidoreductase [Phycisphaerae bacterium]|nr:Gfo/Idh/MocA family oxidoreductase [Phycisphaerae bacterium]
MKNEQVGVCIIGAGRAGMIHARAVAQLAGARVAALVDSDVGLCREGCRELGVGLSYGDYREALEDAGIDAVIVATPTRLHHDIVVSAARAGKHILCEKPMAMSVVQCAEMIRAAEENRVKLQIGFMRRFDRGFQQAKEVVQQGDIGEVVLVKSLTRGPSLPKRWQYDVGVSNGPLAEVNSHDIDTLRWFTESEFAHVYAIAGNYRCPEARAEFPDFYDNVSLVASFANGMQGFIDGAVSVKYGYDARLEVLGTEGILFVGQLADGSVAVCRRGGEIVQSAVASWRDLFAQAYMAEDEAFMACVRDDTEPVATGYDGMMAVKVVEAGNQAIQEGRPVYLNYEAR